MTTNLPPHPDHPFFDNLSRLYEGKCGPRRDYGEGEESEEEMREPEEEYPDFPLDGEI